jgi:agmatine/peptidylarginine deiminase
VTREEAWRDWQARRARWPKQSANATGRYDSMFEALRSCDEVQLYPPEAETVKQLAARVRSMLMQNPFTGVDRWAVKSGPRYVLVKRIGPR